MNQSLAIFIILLIGISSGFNRQKEFESFKKEANTRYGNNEPDWEKELQEALSTENYERAARQKFEWSNYHLKI